MNEPTGEKPSVKGSSFQLDKDPDKITSDQIKFYLNDGFMRGKVPAEEFVDRIIDTAKRNDRVAVAALQVYAISLGNLTHSSMMVDGYTRSILSQGIENEFTQSIIRAISPEHIKILRELYITGNNDAGNALLLSILHAPRFAEQEDMNILCKEFEG
ncbi:MAG: hypothetical protein U1E54_00545, partial [Candidatus Levybacteria bacterium]|nr:hypothetical protein [Candidatus Levybacteria bacterium]